MNGNTRAIAQVALLFVLVVSITGGIFYLQNKHLHQKADKVAFEACMKSRRLADTQAEILEAVIRLTEAASVTLSEETRRIARQELPKLKLALQFIPQFKCQRR